jgi:hypothetical protein
MFERLPNGDLQVSVRWPLVYFDHCAMRCISSEAAKRSHLRQTFATRGTLMISVVNMVEMARNSGESYERIRGMLDELGPHCLPVDLDLATVERKLQRGIPPPACYLVPMDMLAHIVRAMPDGQFRFGTALQELHDEDFRERAPGLLRRPTMLRDLNNYRARHERGEKMLPLPKPKYSLRWVELSLVRRLIKDSKTIEENDIIDIFHAVIPLAFANVVALDSAWANYANSLNIPGTFVFAATDAGLNEALECIRAVDVRGAPAPVAS